MKAEKITKTSWPRNRVESIKCRKRDLVIRVSNWTRQSPRTGEPAYDVEVYENGIYDWNKSETFTTAYSGRTKQQARQAAIAFAQKQMNLLR